MAQRMSRYTDRQAASTLIQKRHSINCIGKKPAFSAKLKAPVFIALRRDEIFFYLQEREEKIWQITMNLKKLTQRP